MAIAVEDWNVPRSPSSIKFTAYRCAWERLEAPLEKKEEPAVSPACVAPRNRSKRMPSSHIKWTAVNFKEGNGAQSMEIESLEHRSSWRSVLGKVGTVLALDIALRATVARMEALRMYKKGGKRGRER